MLVHPKNPGVIATALQLDLNTSWCFHEHLQARIVKMFPSKYLVTTLTCLLGSLQCLVVGISLGHSRAEWKLKLDLQLLTIVYSVISQNPRAHC
jgi:ABC-type dipeptide/oligopeptide/nickel transport system permease component